MKQFLMFFAAIFGVISFTSCGGSDDDNNLAALLLQQNSLTNTFTLPATAAATYVAAAQPAAEGEAFTGTVNYNQRALAGGSNYITITSPVPYEEFYVGLADQVGYYAIPATAVFQQLITTRAEQTYTYLIQLNYTVNYSRDVAVMLSGRYTDGSYSGFFEAPVVYEVTATGALSLNLTFDNATDVDLWLIMPNGTRYYYGNRGVAVNGNGEEVNILDHDSNPSCHIDNLNNENIVVPLNMIQKGEYKVVVDMFNNCTYGSKPTNWDLVARYKGNLIVPTYGTNPINGTYPADAGNHDETVVMKFVINEGLTPQQTEDMKSIMRPLPLDIMSQMKVEEASWK